RGASRGVPDAPEPTAASAPSLPGPQLPQGFARLFAPRLGVTVAVNVPSGSKLAGTVVARGNRVTLRNEEGPWPWLTLVRTRDGKVLYGVANDPASETNVMLKLERDGRYSTVPPSRFRRTGLGPVLPLRCAGGG